LNALESAQEGVMSASRIRLLFVAPAVAMLGFALAIAAASAERSAASSPTVVELYQSQGCSSCPPANANILALADREDLLVLSFGVLYWDSLGWKDTFASRENTQRQYDYTNGGLNRRYVATPQVIINGHVDIIGANRAELANAIAGAKLSLEAPTISITGLEVAIAAGAPPAGGADVWLVRYDPRTVEVPIGAGENSGRTLPHRNVVRELIRLGGWNGKTATYALPQPADPAYRTAILLQGVKGGRIIASFKA